MKISQEDAILIFLNRYLSKQYGAQRLLSEFQHKCWKRESVSSLIKKIHKVGTIHQQWQAIFRAYWRECWKSGGPCAKSGSCLWHHHVAAAGDNQTSQVPTTDCSTVQITDASLNTLLCIIFATTIQRLHVPPV